MVGVAEGREDVVRERAQVPADEVPRRAVHLAVVQLDQPVEHYDAAAGKSNGCKDLADISGVESLRGGHHDHAEGGRRVEPVVGPVVAQQADVDVDAREGRYQRPGDDRANDPLQPVAPAWQRPVMHCGYHPQASQDHAHR